jgi:ketosteroid isomerase-like protein
MSDETLGALADKVAIAELTAIYNRAIDDLDAAAVVATFCEDGVLDLGLGRPWEGREAIAKFVGRLDYGTVHATTDAVVAVDGDRAEQVSTLLLCKRRRDRSASEFWLTGRYFDALARIDGAWRFSHRRALLDLAVGAE